MKELVLVRIDDRLIHGQVVTQWIKTCHANVIYVIDDALKTNTLMNRVLKAAAPPGVQVLVQTADEAIESLMGEPGKNEKVLILVKIPQVLEKLIDNGVQIPKIILGGMGLTAARKRFHKNVAASEEEVECMKRIVSKGVPIFYQIVPSDSALNIEKLF